MLRVAFFFRKLIALCFGLAKTSMAGPVNALTYTYDIAISGGFTGFGQISFATTSGFENKPHNDLLAYSFAVTAQDSFSSGSGGPGSPAPLPVTFGMSELGAVSWLIEPADGSSLLSLANEPIQVGSNAYDFGIITLGAFDYKVTCFSSLFNPGARLVRHARYAIFQIAEAAFPRSVFAGILDLINGLRGPLAVMVSA